MSDLISQLTAHSCMYEGEFGEATACPATTRCDPVVCWLTALRLPCPALLPQVKVERIALSRRNLLELSPSEMGGARTLYELDGRGLQLKGPGGRTQSRTPYQG